MSIQRQPDGPEGTAITRLLTIDEVAEYLQVPVQTLYHWRYKRTGPKGVRVGRFVRYHRAEVESWLKTRTTACEEQAPARRRRQAG